jgi:hypothetical protein
MGNEAFEELEEPEQFEDADLRLPEGLTKEVLWEEMNMVMEHGDDGGEMGSHQHFVPPNGMFNYHQLPGYNPHELLHQNGAINFNGFVSTTVNGAHGMDGNDFMNGIGHYGLMNDTARPDWSVIPSTLLHNGGTGEDSSSQSSVSPLNGIGSTSGSASAALLTPLTDPQTFNASGLAKGMADFDIGEYLHFDDGENAVKVEEDKDIYGTLDPSE